MAEETFNRIPDEPEYARPIRRVSWGAIFAGALVGMVSMLCLSLLGLSIGLGVVDPTEETHPMTGVGIGAGIWFVVTFLISLFLSGWTAARLCGIPRHVDGLLHGVVTWSLVTMVTLFLLTTAIGRMVSGVGSILATTLQTAGQGIGMAASQIGQALPPIGEGPQGQQLQTRVEEFLRQTNDPALQPEALRQRAGQASQATREGAGTAAEQPGNAFEQLKQTLSRVGALGRDVAGQVDREDLANVIAANTGKSQEESRRIADNWIQFAQQTRARAEQAGEEIREKGGQIAERTLGALSAAAAWSVAAIVLGGLAAALGGWLGRPSTIPVAPRAA